MTKNLAALIADAPQSEEVRFTSHGAQVVDIDDVAQRRERLAAYAKATRAVVVYRFAFPDGAMTPALNPGDQRDAHDQLHLLVGLAGGAIAKSHGGLAARIPKTLAARFEAQARALIEAYLIALDIGEDG